MTLSISAKSLTGAEVGSMPKEAAAVSIEPTNNGKYGAVCGLKRTATCRMEGAISLSNSIHLPPIANSNAVNPGIAQCAVSRLAAEGAGTDEAGHAFQFEGGRVFRSEAGHPWRQSHGSI